MSVIHRKIRYEELPRERGSPMVSAGIYEEFAKKLADNDRPYVQGRIQIGGECCRKSPSMSGSWVFHKGQPHGECRKTCGRGDKRTEIIRMSCSTLKLDLRQGCSPCRFNGRTLLANLLQSSRSTFSRGSWLSFFASKKGPWSWGRPPPSASVRRKST